jgi:hypothetical protein
MKRERIALLRVLVAAIVLFCSVPAFAVDPEDAALAFATAGFKTLNVTVDGES